MPLMVMAAAVADFRPAEYADHKIKKTGDTMHLDLVKAPDILASVSADKRRPFVVGFAAETENLIANASEKRLAKNADWSEAVELLRSLAAFSRRVAARRSSRVWA